MPNMNINSKEEGSRVICDLKNSEVLGLWFGEFDELCKQLGENWYVEVTYDVVKKGVVCDIYSDWFENEFAGKNFSLTQAKKELKEAVRKVKEEYRKKIFMEAAEIAARIGAETYSVYIKASDKMFDWSMYPKVGDKILLLLSFNKISSLVIIERWQMGRCFYGSELFWFRPFYRGGLIMIFPKTNAKIVVVTTTIKRSTF